MLPVFLPKSYGIYSLWYTVKKQKGGLRILLSSSDIEDGDIDWETLMEVGRNDNYAKEVKMAECLTDLIVPPQCFKCIYVPSEEVRQIVEEKLEKYDIDFPPPYVNVMKQWFNC